MKQEKEKWEGQRGASERAWVSIDRTRERFLLCLEELRVFGRVEWGQNGKDANRLVKLEESNVSPPRIVEIVGNSKRLGQLELTLEVCYRYRTRKGHCVRM